MSTGWPGAMQSPRPVSGSDIGALSVAVWKWWALSMKVLFVHNNFPAQFQNVVEALKEMSGFELAAIGAEGAQVVQGVTVHRYAVPSIDVSPTHSFARRFDAECRRAEHVLMAAID